MFLRFVSSRSTNTFSAFLSRTCRRSCTPTTCRSTPGEDKLETRAKWKVIISVFKVWTIRLVPSNLFKAASVKARRKNTFCLYYWSSKTKNIVFQEEKREVCSMTSRIWAESGIILASWPRQRKEKITKEWSTMTKKRLTRPDPLKILSSTSKFLSLSLLITIFFMFKLFLKG